MTAIYLGTRLAAPALAVNGSKYGATVDTFLGDVDANGVLQKSTVGGNIVLNGVQEIGVGALAYKFILNSNVTGLSAPDLIAINGESACDNAFAGCNLTSVNISELVSISGKQACYGMFNGNKNLATVSFSKLESISGIDACILMFADCESLASVSFPSLKLIDGNLDIFYEMFIRAGASTGLTVHFPSNMQTVVSGLTGYPTFGADSSIITLAFDLPATA